MNIGSEERHARFRAALAARGYDPTPEECAEPAKQAAAKWAKIEQQEAEILARYPKDGT
ncbi:hypothetical protein [Longimycelium tulufanense]|uniref:hypothetical protein n=1 Tax=Longimycelium tulufanense TaxID=907463 RepID=UPI0016698CD5|nr:hypothetical protein [Longimycelium tulufanense]